MFHDQAAFRVRFEWGQAAIRYLAPFVDAVVIVDVVSFSTATDVALGRGATVWPYRWKDDSATRFAEQHGAMLANHERRVTGGYSLSPQSLSTLPRGTRLVLPSPNGATLSTWAAELGIAVFTACLRNAPAVAVHIRDRFERVLVVAAGERWPDGMFRPAVEDLWGAGAVITALNLPVSPEAQAAAQAFQAVQRDLAAQLWACSSGRELIERGFEGDLDWASAYGVSSTVPILKAGAYLSAQ
jgi:2-phosphosulfolactate phosphatase